jgi:hypothetical protein
MTENKQKRPTLMCTKIGLFSATGVLRAPEMNRSKKASFRRASRAQNLNESRQKSRLKPQVMHRVIHTVHRAPVDITVDKGTSTISEKPQQNQHFKYHSRNSNLHHDVNKAFTSKPLSTRTAPCHSARNITLIWNMHRSGAACSLNVTSIGICLSRQHMRIYRKPAFFAPDSTAAVDSPGMRDYSEADLWNARWPTSRGFFRGLHESA